MQNLSLHGSGLHQKGVDDVTQLMSRAEQEKEGARPMASSSKPAQKILPSQQSAVPPPAPLTSVAPVFYMPSTPSATHSPSVPGSPHPVVMPAHQTIPTISPSNFHFGEQTIVNKTYIQFSKCYKNFGAVC